MRYTHKIQIKYGRSVAVLKEVARPKTTAALILSHLQSPPPAPRSYMFVCTYETHSAAIVKRRRGEKSTSRATLFGSKKKCKLNKIKACKIYVTHLCLDLRFFYFFFRFLLCIYFAGVFFIRVIDSQGSGN